jgi:BirA family biotin operon repressor/biotin-[acetyl-CoA-carboxylase] ligase
MTIQGSESAKKCPETCVCVGPKDRTHEEDAVLAILQSSGYPNQIEYFPGAIRQHFQVVDSTQIQAEKLVNHLPKDTWLILSAEEQIAGRGTHKRRWVSPPQGNLYVTFLVPFPKKDSEKLFFIAQIATIAVSRTVKKLGLEPEIRWPNDLMLNKKKVSGTLCENRTPNGGGDYSALLIGVGLNVNMDESLCNGLDQPVVSLSIEANKVFDKEKILPLLYQDVRECVDQVQRFGFSSFHEELNSMLIFRGEPIIVDREDGQSLLGFFVGIDEMGRMKLRLANNQVVLLHDAKRIRKGDSPVQGSAL